MDSHFLFGVGETSNKDKITLDVSNKNSNELLTNIKEEIDYANTQLCNLNEQLSKMDSSEIGKSFLFRKCSLLVEYLNNVYAFHALKNDVNSDVKGNILKRLNNIKSILDRLLPLESRLSSYLKGANKQTQKCRANAKKSNVVTPDYSLNIQENSSDKNLMPNLSALAMNDSDEDNCSNLQPNLSNLTPLQEDQPNMSDGDEHNGLDEDSINDHISDEDEKNTNISKKSVFVPSKSRYMPYDDTKNGQLTSRKRKEFQDEQKHREELQKSIVDDLLNLETDAPLTYGMKEMNNAGYYEKNNPFSKSSSKKDVQMVKDRRLVLMMNDINDDGKFVDKSMEQLADSMSNKLNSKKHKAKLAKRKALRTRFRKKMFKRR